MPKHRFKTIVLILSVFTLSFLLLTSIRPSDVHPPDEEITIESLKFWNSQRDGLPSESISIFGPNPQNSSLFTSKDTWTDSWLQLDEEFAFYSAYPDFRFCDTRTGCFIRVIGIGPAKQLKKKSLECLFIYNGTKKGVSATKTSLHSIPEDHGFNNTAIYLFCELPNKNSVPEEVVIQRKIPKNESFVEIKRINLRVHSPKTFDEVKSPISTIAVCIRPMFGPFRDVQSLAEFIAYYSLIGVSHFTFYEHAITPQIRQYLELLMQGGSNIELLPWNVPSALSNAWQFAQLAHIQDCIYRNSGYYEYVLSVDLDEYVMFQKHNSFQEFLQFMDHRKRLFGSYLFRNVFFFLEHCEEPKKVYDFPRKPRFQMCINRNVKIWDSFQRSKVLLRPQMVVTGGIHFVWEYVKKKSTYEVSPKVALLYHYRKALGKPSEYKHFEDATAFRYVVPVLESKEFKLLQNFASRISRNGTSLSPT